MSRYMLMPALFLLSAAPALAYGAIAVDKNDSSIEPAYGYSINQPDRATAEQVAVEYCRQYANSRANCQPIVWFETCGAYANSPKYFGYGYGATKAAAIEGARRMCGRDSCIIRVAVCEKR
ncbi:MAG TPA: DUF4189 domain-containing protein [Novosphingobium sp.]|nr:DUF4189 domain-containing protein [Novosphingobium sp.]